MIFPTTETHQITSTKHTNKPTKTTKTTKKLITMITEYLKCHHGFDKRFGCSDCEKEKIKYLKQPDNKSNKKDDKIPIYRGCTNSSCFCTGRCKEIIGYHTK
jgi:hypothetical protein